MITEPVLATSARCVLHHRPSAASESVARYWALTKPELSSLIAVTTAAGFYVGASAAVVDFPWMRLVHAVLGTTLVASGAAGLNQWKERELDARMRRTARRPVAAGLIEPTHALAFASALSLTGLVYLVVTVGILPFVLALGTLASYVFLYTPAKRVTPLCTLIGAVPGAMPTLIGSAAASGQIADAAFVLFAIVFLWQFPHFMAIAWMYREDYERAGFRVLPPEPARTLFVSVHTLVPLFALVPLVVLPVLTSGASVFYGFGAGLLWLGFAYYAAYFEHHKSNVAARRLLMASIVYLPASFALMICSS